MLTLHRLNLWQRMSALNTFFFFFCHIVRTKNRINTVTLAASRCSTCRCFSWNGMDSAASHHWHLARGGKDTLQANTARSSHPSACQSHAPQHAATWIPTYKSESGSFPGLHKQRNISWWLGAERVYLNIHKKYICNMQKHQQWKLKQSKVGNKNNDNCV